MQPGAKPVRVAIVNDYQIVVEGIAAILAPFSDRIEVVELDAQVPTISDVDVLLYDSFGQVQGAQVDVEKLSAGGPARVVIFSWNVDTELVDGAISSGVAGYLWKGTPAAGIVEALEAVSRGDVPRPPERTDGIDEVGDWPGRAQGLSAREAEVVALITQGFSNQEIAERAFLSINTIKTYIRTAYRKMGVERRSQAVVWGVQNGFEPDRHREIRSHGTR